MNLLNHLERLKKDNVPVRLTLKNPLYLYKRENEDTFFVSDKGHIPPTIREILGYITLTNMPAYRQGLLCINPFGPSNKKLPSGRRLWDIEVEERYISKAERLRDY